MFVTVDWCSGRYGCMVELATALVVVGVTFAKDTSDVVAAGCIFVEGSNVGC